jgi:hypothetical protein
LSLLKNLLLVAGLTLATSAHSQPIIDYDAMPNPVQTALTDLDGDGELEATSVFALNDRYDIVTIRPFENRGDRDFDAAFVVPINQSDFDTLEIQANGNLRIYWGCFACGRYHSTSSVTVDARDGEIKVIGYDDSYADRIYAAVITCSVNLLTGDAIVQADDVDKQVLTTNERSYPLSALSTATFPQVCRSAYARYDEDFMVQNYPDG